MYILGEKSDFANQIITLITDTLFDIEQHIIGNAKEIISREPIVCLFTSVDYEAVKCVIPYLNEKSPIIFIKQQWNNEELKMIESIIQESLSTRKQLWHDEMKKLSSLRGTKAQEERIKKLNHWIVNTSAQYYCFSSSQIDFKNNLIKVLQSEPPIQCLYQLITTVSERPPALHWTSLPQVDEAQITFKIVFPQSCFLRSELFELVKRISNVYRWQYQYEWSYGVLFRIEAAKIAIIKHEPETLEISGRIDNAIMDDDSDMMPMKSVWPYLSIALTTAVEYFDELSSQYTTRIIPFGNIFYEKSDAIPRTFDFTQLIISNDLLKRVAYRDNGILYHLNLIQLFPELKPKTIGEIGNMKAKSNITTMKEENDSGNKNKYLHLPERVYHNSCGRRVSFGTVKCIPQPSQKVEPDAELDNVPDEEPMETQYEMMLDNYVDLILDETLREIKIS
ncbi:Vacuolar protein sorting-associated protein [Dirofilaria immitis]